MKPFFALSFLFSVLATTAQPVTVHEWGTFTTLCGSDGTRLNGLFRDDEKLPAFVQSPAFRTHYWTVEDKGWSENIFTRLNNVNVKMETPVLYFYADNVASIPFNVGIKFNNGSVSQFYPAPYYSDTFQRDYCYGIQRGYKPVFEIDFSKYSSNIGWMGTILPKSYQGGYTTPKNQETHTWTAPRATQSNMLSIGTDIEKFIFYRGIGNFEIPVKMKFTDQFHFDIQNDGNEAIPYCFAYEYEKGKKVNVIWEGTLGTDEKVTVDRRDFNKDTAALFSRFVDQLCNSGLYRDEAESMLETWRRSYFQTNGIKVFWIVPRKITDSILAIQLNPAPVSLERVIVGRSEILSPEFENRLLTQKLPMAYQVDDRYAIAYSERIKQLKKQPGSVIPVQSELEFSAYPNPSSGSFRIFINTPSVAQVQLELFDTKGSLLKSVSLNENYNFIVTDLDCTEYPDGTYLLKITHDEGIRWERIVISK